MIRWIICMISVILLLTACNPQKEARDTREIGRQDQSLYKDEMDQTRFGYEGRTPPIQEEDRFEKGQNEIGYFRYIPENYPNQSEMNEPNVFIDRPTLAKYIAELVSVLPNVKESTVLVTDDHVFVGLLPQNGKEDETMVKEAKRTAESVTPRFYKIHVTDRAELQKSINELGLRMKANGDLDGVRGNLNKLLRKMGDHTLSG